MYVYIYVCVHNEPITHLQIFSLGSHLSKLFCPLQWLHNECDGVNSPASRVIIQPFGQAQIKKKHQSSPSLAFVREIHRRPANSPHKGPVTRKMFPFDDVIMLFLWVSSARACFLNLGIIWRKAHGRTSLFDPGPSALVKSPCCHGYWKFRVSNDHLKVAMKVFPELLSSRSLCIVV